MIHTLLEHKARLVAVVAIVAFLFRFAEPVMQHDISLGSIGNALEFASLISAAMIAILIYLKQSIEAIIVKHISNKKHTAVFGLGAFSTALLENERFGANRYIICEKNVQNEKVEYFRKSGMGVIEGDVMETGYLDRLNFETMEYAVISTGNDLQNIELAVRIIEHCKQKGIDSTIKLVVHIVDKDLNALFHQKTIVPQMDGSHKIDIKTFSFYEEIAASFFETSYIDGMDNTVMESDDEYHIVIAGDGLLALNMVYEAGKIAHLPNENRLHVHLVDKDAQRFKQKILKSYGGIKHVLTLHAHNMDAKTPEYFDGDEHSVWKCDNLTHVIVCYDDETRNADIVTNLLDKTYLTEAVDGTLHTRISFALYHAHSLSQKIDADREHLYYIHSFGDERSICTRERLLEEKTDLIAKLIHKGYAEEYNPDFLYDLNDKAVRESIEKKWYDASRLSDKLSNKAQSKHIGMKLKALGLTYTPSSKPAEELLVINRKLLNEKLDKERETLGVDDRFLYEYSKQLPKLWDDKSSIEVDYFPKAYSTMFEKLIRAEHNRWNAFHYLNGWKYSSVKSKPKKEHDCLKPLKAFDKPEQQLTVIYDIYAIMYMPNYLANAGFEIRYLD